VRPLGAGRFRFALVRGDGKAAPEVLDEWESLWPSDSAGSSCGVCSCGQNPPPGEATVTAITERGAGFAWRSPGALGEVGRTASLVYDEGP